MSVLDRDGTRITDIALASEARCVAAAVDGTIYAGVRDHVEVFDRKGNRLATWDSPGKRTWFTGLAVGENDVFAADAGNRVVLRYDKSGKLVGRIGEKNKERNIPGLIVPSPYLDVCWRAMACCASTIPGGIAWKPTRRAATWSSPGASLPMPLKASAAAATRSAWLSCPTGAM